MFSYSFSSGVIAQTSGDRTPGRASPLGTTQALFQITQGTVTRGAAVAPASVH